MQPLSVRSITLALPIVMTMTGSLNLWAQDRDGENIPDLMEDKHCDLCHHETERRSGPPYRMIATMYAERDREKSMDKLTRKILKGGMGTWGIQPMPASGNISSEQARAMANWILNLR